MTLLPAIYFLLSIQLLYAYDERKPNVTISQHFHNDNCLDDYDITTIYRLTDTHVIDSNAGLEVSTTTLNIGYPIEIHSRTNSIGIPISIDNEIDFNLLSDGILHLNITEFHKYGFITNNSRMSIYFDSNYWKRSSIESTGKKCNLDSDAPATNYNINYMINSKEHKQNPCINSLEYKYDKHYHPYSDVNQTFLTINWKPVKKQSCVSITYFHSWSSDIEITMSISDESNTLITSTILEKHESIVTLKVANMDLIQDHKYKMLLKRKYSNTLNYNENNIYFGNWFELLRITQCSDDDEEEVRVGSKNAIAHQRELLKPFNILGYDGTTDCVKIQTSSAKSCLNGGYMQSTRPTCVCPPGFKGQFCETGCGSNLYGADCKGVCSMHTDEMCRGLLMCTKYYGCTCPPGLTGPLCDKDCAPGKYGADCQQTCSSNCHNNKCNQYTGVCYEGCSQGYLPPYCLQRHPYLINPPALLSAKYDGLEMEFNFNSDNIKGGDTNIKLIYYQIFYKCLKWK